MHLQRIRTLLTKAGINMGREITVLLEYSFFEYEYLILVVFIMASENLNKSNTKLNDFIIR